MKSVSIVIALMLVSVVCPTVNAQGNLTCYVCKYDTAAETGDEGCMDPFDKSGIANVTCDGVCLKQIIDNSDGKQYSRSCHTKLEGVCNELSNVQSTQGAITRVCCPETMCNAAGVINFSIAMSILAPLAFRLF